MSQKTKIVGLKHLGASVYLGDDSYGNPKWSRNPEEIAQWLSDGWRFLFNYSRGLRGFDVGIGPTNQEGESQKELKARCTWLAGIPSRVYQSAFRSEDTDWFSGLKRKKSCGGKAPGFRSKGKAPQSFICWFAGGDNARFTKTGKSSGVVTLSGQVASGKFKDKTRRWKLIVRVRISEPIRKYTSVHVNLSSRMLTFTNMPEPLERTQTGSEVGVDRGVVHTLASSNGEFFDIPKEDPTKYKSLQKKMSRQVKGSIRRGKTLTSMRKIKSHEVARRTDWIHKVTTTLVKENDVIVLEDLKITNMVRKGKHKRGLNRSILENNWGQFQSILSYKATLAGVKVVLVNPAYTSQECNLCHYTSRENRESQSVFKCQECGHRANADTNAARNILDRGTGQSIDLGRGGKIRLPKASAKESTSCEASTAGPPTKTKVLGRGQQSNSR